jgi:hypothetical protein
MRSEALAGRRPHAVGSNNRLESDPAVVFTAISGTQTQGYSRRPFSEPRKPICDIHGLFKHNDVIPKLTLILPFSVLFRANIRIAWFEPELRASREIPWNRLWYDEYDFR